MPEARCVSRQAASKGCQDPTPCWIARSKQDPIHHGHGAQHSQCPRQPGTDLYCNALWREGTCCVALLISTGNTEEQQTLTCGPIRRFRCARSSFRVASLQEKPWSRVCTPGFALLAGMGNMNSELATCTIQGTWYVSGNNAAWKNGCQSNLTGEEIITWQWTRSGAPIVTIKNSRKMQVNLFGIISNGHKRWGFLVAGEHAPLPL